MRSAQLESGRTAAKLAAIFLSALGLVGSSSTPCQASEPVERLLGIDVSHHSGAIDWGAVAKHELAFVYVKATEGVDDADPMFEQHWQKLGELGVARGAYHFYVTEDDPEQQARFFLSRLRLQPGDLAPVVDIESIGAHTGEGLTESLQKFLEIVEKGTGTVPVIYTGSKFWNAHLPATFGRYPLWVAEYGVAEPALPHGWSQWHLWQFEGDAEVPGIEKGADKSRAQPGGGLDQLRIPRPDAPSGQPHPPRPPDPSSSPGL